jgi:GT2 family glycosyltransferase
LGHPIIPLAATLKEEIILEMNSTNLPLASVIIPNYNGLHLLKEYLPSVLEETQGHEVIVVDDASTDGSVEFLRKTFPKVKIVALKTNVRFAAACNKGAEMATGEIIILLNTDVCPRSGFLIPLLKPFEQAQVFAVGCKEIQKEAGKEWESGCSGGRFRRGMIEHWRAKRQVPGATLWVSGGSAAFRKNVWSMLGGLDTLFSPAYEEDRDISYRALKRGYSILFAPNSVVNHNHKTTNISEFGNVTIQAASYKNSLLFIWKNITSRDLLVKHLVWLPYHILVTSIRSRGMFLWGFFWAIRYLPSVIKKRAVELSESVKTDEEIFAMHSNR